ncbi:MAG TPA: S1 RNA-binding domain-containing protein, partial [Clostridiaceae bacterium]|nr:S1 RNA-binding domain-containing protein [Clostridiaceae bacterium]
KQKGTKQLCHVLGITSMTLQDLVDDLKKAGRDGRKDYTLPSRSENITDITDLKEGMILQGIVRNVVQFGAFVDIGVHRDGLVHISEMADHFVSDPTQEVHAGQPVKVRVLAVDPERNQISLSMKHVGHKS